MTSNLTRKTVNSVNWGLGKTLGQNIVAFFASIILARLIAPGEFGLLAIAMIFVGLGKIFANLGINTAIIQKKNLNSKNLRAALYVSLLSSLCIYILIWLIAPFAAEFFNESRAESVIRWIGLLFLFNGLTTIGQGVLMRHFKYRPIFFIEVVAYILGYGIVGITLATLGYGVWSLVWGVLTQYALMAFFYLIYVRIPLMPVFKEGEYQKIIRFGGGVSLLGFFNYIAMNLDNLIIGRLLQAHQLGLYSKAFGLMQLPVRNLSYTLGGVSMSTFSAIQDKKDVMRSAFYRAADLISLVACPVAVIMFISAEYMILGLYGPQWVDAVSAFRILSLGIIVKAFFGVTGSIAKSTDNVFKETWRQLVFATVLGGLSLLLIDYGIEGVALAVTFSSVLFFLLMVQLSLRIINGAWWDFLKCLKGGIVFSFFLGILNLTSIYVIEYFFGDVIMPIKLSIVLAIMLVFGLWIFIKVPSAWITPGRNWLIKTYASALPGKVGKYLKSNLK